MNYEELQKALSGDSPQVIVTRDGKSVRLIDLACMSGEDLVANCKVIMKGEEAYLRSCPITQPFEGPTGRYGFGHLWKGMGVSTSSASPQLKDLSAFDCLRELYDHSKAHNGVGWVV